MSADSLRTDAKRWRRRDLTGKAVGLRRREICVIVSDHWWTKEKKQFVSSTKLGLFDLNRACAAHWRTRRVWQIPLTNPCGGNCSELEIEVQILPEISHVKNKKWDLFPFHFVMTKTSTKSSTSQQREQRIITQVRCVMFSRTDFNPRLGPKLNKKIKSQQHEVVWRLARGNAFLENRWWPCEPQTVLFVQQREAAW